MRAIISAYGRRYATRRRNAHSYEFGLLLSLWVVD